jgi:hypothetical protein
LNESSSRIPSRDMSRTTVSIWGMEAGLGRAGTGAAMRRSPPTGEWCAAGSTLSQHCYS